MDFTTKKILNNGRYILSTISRFFIVITYFIVPYFNATNVVQNNFQRTILSKSESSTLSAPPLPAAATTTTRRRRRRTKTKSESSTLATPPPPSPSATTTTKKMTTKTTSIFSLIFESSTSTPSPRASTTTKRVTIKAPAIFSSKTESTSAPPPPTPLALPPPPPTTTTTTTTRSTFSSLFDSTPYSSPWMYSTSGDLIGSESGVFMASTSELEEYEQLYRNRKFKKNIVEKEKQPKSSKKEYPPPIPSWRGKLPRDVPWSLSRHVVDERLILKEESMEYYEYFEATREDGRLVLKLIVLKSNVKGHDKSDTNNDTIDHDQDEVSQNQREKKKRIQEETQRDFEMVNEEIGTKKRRGLYKQYFI